MGKIAFKQSNSSLEFDFLGTKNGYLVCKWIYVFIVTLRKILSRYFDVQIGWWKLGLLKMEITYTVWYRRRFNAMNLVIIALHSWKQFYAMLYIVLRLEGFPTFKEGLWLLSVHLNFQRYYFSLHVCYFSCKLIADSFLNVQKWSLYCFYWFNRSTFFFLTLIILVWAIGLLREQSVK